MYLTAYVLTLPYGFFYDRNTRTPLTNIAASTNPADCRSHVEAFFKAKIREAQYVQVAVRDTVPHSSHTYRNNQLGLERWLSRLR